MDEDIDSLRAAIANANAELNSFMEKHGASVRVRAYVNYCEDEHNRLVVELTTKLATLS